MLYGIPLDFIPQIELLKIFSLGYRMLPFCIVHKKKKSEYKSKLLSGNSNYTLLSFLLNTATISDLLRT